MSQDDYIRNKLDFLRIETGKRISSSKLTDEEKSMFRGMVGQIRWIKEGFKKKVIIITFWG